MISAAQKEQTRAVKVPFLQINTTPISLKEEILKSIERVVDSNQFVLADEVRKFERAWADYCEADFCVGVGNGLDALQLSLIAAGIEPGDEVLVPESTFIATWFAVSNVGASPVSVPVREDTLTIDPTRIAEFITPRTRAILPVHLYGQPADLEEILEISAQNELPVIEDAAQAHGASYRGRRIGSHGTLTAWSFYPGKNLGAFGDGGAITTNDEKLANKLRKLRNYGSTEKYIHEIIGFNSRLDEIQAAVLGQKLRHLDTWNLRRAEIATRYSLNFEGALSQYSSLISFPTELPDRESSWHLYVVRCKKRDELVKRLRAAGIEILLHYPLDPIFQGAYQAVDAADHNGTVANASGKDVFSLPIGPHLDDDQVSYVIETVIEVVSNLYGEAQSKAASL